MAAGKGGANSNAKLNESQVLQIKALLAEKHPHKKIASTFGVSRETVSNINTGRRWKHLVSPTITKFVDFNLLEKE